MTPTRALDQVTPAAALSLGAAPRARRLLVEASVGALLVLTALVALVAGGWFSVAASDAAGARRGGAATPVLILQCPLGVHRLPLGSRSERRAT